MAKQKKGDRLVNEAPGRGRHKEEEFMKLARILALAGVAAFAIMGPAAVAQQAPKFEIDTSWPKPLPNNWIFGQIGGIGFNSSEDF